MNLELKLKREKFLSDRTIGTLLVGDIWQCWTLEDKFREVKDQPVSEWKVKGETAIPVGRYQIKLRDSPHFGKDVPWVTNVVGFEWILIHAGNRPKDTDGCILVGENFDDKTGNILGSRDARDIIYGMIRDTIKNGDEVWITVT